MGMNEKREAGVMERSKREEIMSINFDIAGLQ